MKDKDFPIIGGGTDVAAATALALRLCGEPGLGVSHHIPLLKMALETYKLDHTIICYEPRSLDFLLPPVTKEPQLTEWEKRRKQSADAKAELVEKLKRKNK